MASSMAARPKRLSIRTRSNANGIAAHSIRADGMSDTPSQQTGPPSREKPFQFSVRAMLTGVAVGALLLGILVPLVRRAYQESLKAECSNSLKQVGLALHNYHDTYKCSRFARLCSPDGKPWHSWRMSILPFLEANPHFDSYRFDEPWNGPHNRKLDSVVMLPYHCPAEDPSAGKGISSRHVGGACVLLADGSVHFLSSDTDAEILRMLLTIADGYEIPAAILSNR
jgi:hypothetical protein